MINKKLVIFGIVFLFIANSFAVIFEINESPLTEWSIIGGSTVIIMCGLRRWVDKLSLKIANKIMGKK